MVKEENGKKELRETLACEKCASKFVYALADMTLVCRRCGHRTPPKE